MQVEQQVWKAGGGQHAVLHTAARANEEWLHGGIETHERARDREPGVQMSTRTAAGKPDGARHQGGDIGSVAPLPITRSFSLPMLTRMPVSSMESTMLDRP